MSKTTINLTKEEVRWLDFASYLNRYKHLESINYHAEYIVLQAKRYGTDEQIAVANELLAMQLKAGYLKDEINARRKALSAELEPLYAGLYA